MTRRRSVKEAVAQPLGRIAAATTHQRSDWSARARVTAGDAERYTRFVFIMKRTLLVAALALIAAVTAYSIQPRQQTRVATAFERLGIVSGDLAMIKPKLTGSDDEGNPFVVTADSAIQDGRNERRARLNNVEFDTTLKAGGWINVTAMHGLLDVSAPPPHAKPGGLSVKQKASKGKLTLSDNVAMFTGDGYEMHTDLALVDVDKGLLVGPHPVKGQGPLGTMRADKFWITRVPAAQTPGTAPPPAGSAPGAPKAKPRAAAMQIFLVGNVRMTFYIKGAKKK